MIVLSLFLISSFRNIQIDEQITKQQALSDSVMLTTKFTIEQAIQNLVQISRDTNVALAGQSGLFGYSAANALSKYVSDSEFVSLSVLLDSKNMIVEASPEGGLLLDALQLEQLGLTSDSASAFEASIDFVKSAELTQTIYSLTNNSSNNAKLSPDILVLSAPLYLSETETLDSRSTYTGRVFAFILLENITQLVQQHSASLTVERLYINEFSSSLKSIQPSRSAITTSSGIQLLDSDISILADFFVLQAEALAAVDRLTIEYSIYAAAIVLVFIALGSLFVRAELKPLDTLNTIVSRYRTGDLSPHNYKFKFSEFDRVSKLLSEMADNISEYQLGLEGKVALRTEALENALSEVKTINRELIRTQNQLVESEKMSQIGVLVAGVAHEVNTPIGVCVTATSILEDKIQRLTEAYEKNQLSRKVLTDFIDNANNCIDILSKNTERAADLIHSFKSVSVDQSSERKRQIVIREYIELTIRSLQKELQRNKVTVNVSGDLGYTIETYPGAISQILSNLILNSVKHGFKQQSQPRKIDIHVEVTPDNELDITFQDNGQGVPADSLPKLFEPFYTTGRQSGGSGLGLSIVYNLATQRLGGKINCYCEPNSGLRLFIEFPIAIIDTETSETA